MGKVFAEISMSLDGFVAGPKPSLKDPLGIGGEQLHEWVLKLEAWRKPHGRNGGETGPENNYVKDSFSRAGAVIMGRKMYSGGDGPWEHDPNLDGWWGENPPFHVPVFVLTHIKRSKVDKDGGTSFTFVTDGIESALSQAKAVAGNRDISISGGANTIQQYVKAKLLDELEIHLVPVLLGGGTLLLKNLEEAKLKKIKVVDFPPVTHIKYQLK